MIIFFFFFSCFPDNVDHKEDCHCHQNIVETRDPGNATENEVTTFLCLVVGGGGQIENIWKKTQNDLKIT